MTVYVDDMKAPYGRLILCHMIADTTGELLSMADQIGVARKWFQNAGTAREHFDIALSKKNQAIAAGAKPITMRQLGCMCVRRRVTGQLGSPDDAVAWVHERSLARYGAEAASNPAT